MRRLIPLISFVALLTACAPASQTPAAATGPRTPTSTQLATRATASATPTPLTPTSQSAWTPETLYGYPPPQTPIPLPTCDPTKDCFSPWTPDVQRQELPFYELYLGKYVLRRWCDVNSPEVWRSCAVTISSRGSTQLEIWSHPALFGEETGADLTGRGLPDIVIIDYPGGNCCIHTRVYEAGETLTKILDIGSEQPGKFIDLNGDGIDEFVFKTDRHFSLFCSMCTVWAPHVYEYRSGTYVPATYKYKELLSTDIRARIDYLSQFTEANPNVPFYFQDVHYNPLFDTPTIEDQEFQKYQAQTPDYDVAVNAVYNLVVLYLLAGQPSDAQKLLRQYFPADKSAQYLIAIREDVSYWLPP